MNKGNKNNLMSQYGDAKKIIMKTLISHSNVVTAALVIMTATDCQVENLK